MKNSTCKYILIVTLSLLASVKGDCQLSQYAIGSAGNELATKVRYYPADQSTIIAGYTYDYSGGTVSNCQAIVMKVFHGGVIAWQKTFGVPTKNNIIKDMIITQDGNIVVVGTVGGSGALYADNTAAIIKYDAHNGNLIWQTCLRDVATTTGGEMFCGVTELTDGTHRLVAIGAHNYTPSGAAGMICVFHSDGTFIYDEILDIPSFDAFYGVTTSAAGNSIYTCGIYNGNSHDGRIISYTPGTTNGTVNWSKYFDFYLNGSLPCNYFLNIYLSGTKLIVGGASMVDYSTSGGLCQFVMSLNAADGSGAQIKSIQNSGAGFTNTPCIAVKDSDRIFAIQSPSAVYYDATEWVSGASSSTVVNEITSINSGTSNSPVKFVSSMTGVNSFLDVDYHSGLLQLAGATNLPSGFGNNDMYYVVAATGLSSINHDCDTAHASISITSCVYTNPVVSYSSSSFVPVYSTVDTGTSHLSIRQLCGDLDMPSGVNDFSETIAEIYPNPFTQSFNIKSGSIITNLKITDLFGREVFYGSYSVKEAVVDMSTLTRGMYYVQVNNSHVLKIIKE